MTILNEYLIRINRIKYEIIIFKAENFFNKFKYNNKRWARIIVRNTNKYKKIPKCVQNANNKRNNDTVILLVHKLYRDKIKNNIATKFLAIRIGVQKSEIHNKLNVINVL